MAAPDCAFCESSGFRSCDVCGGPVMQRAVRGPEGQEWCAYCLEDHGLAVVGPPAPIVEALQARHANPNAAPLDPKMMRFLESIGVEFG